MVNGFYNVPIFTLMIFGMLNKRAPAWAAKVTLVFFIIAYGITQLPSTISFMAWKEHISWLSAFSSLHFLHIMAILFVISIVFMFITGIFWPAANKYDDSKDLQVVDITPWKHGVVTSIAIVVCVFLLYVLFSSLGIAA